MRPLVSKELCLRPLVPDDADDFVKAVRESVVTVGRWMPWCHSDYSTNEAMQWFSTCAQNRVDESAFDLGIFSADGKELLGGIGLNGINWQYNFCNLGYWIRESRQGQGIATQSAQMMTRFGFSKLGLTRIEIVVALDNAPSIAVARKLGAVYEGLLSNRLIYHGVPMDASMFALVPDTTTRDAQQKTGQVCEHNHGTSSYR